MYLVRREDVNRGMPAAMTHSLAKNGVRRTQSTIEKRSRENVERNHYQAMAQSPPLQGGSHDSVGDPAILGVLTVSDRASRGIYSDESGPAILQFFQEALRSE